MPDKKPYTLLHDRPNCIGCGVCISLSPEFWVMNKDGKSDIIDCVQHADTTEERQIDQKDFDANLMAAQCCPVKVIRLVDNNTDKKII